MFTLDAAATFETVILIEPNIELALDVFNEKCKIATGVSAQGSLGASVQVQVTNGEATSCFPGVDVRVYAQAGFSVNPWTVDSSIYKQQFPALDKQCLTFGALESQGLERREKRQFLLSNITTTTTTTVSTATVTTPNGFTSAPVVNVTALFFPIVLGTFQLALESDPSIVVVVGNDHNLYLSSKNVTNTTATTEFGRLIEC